MKILFKHHLYFLLYMITVPICLSSQDIVGDGDLTVGGGDITFVDDINGISPKVITINNSAGDLIMKTLGAPGGILTLLRDGNILLENDDNDKVVEFEVNASNDLLINREQGGSNMMTVTEEGVIGLGTTNPATDHKIVIFQNPNESSIYIDNGQGAPNHGAYSVEVDALQDYNWKYFGLNQGAYINQSNGFAYTVFSDRHLKSNIESLSQVLDRVLQLRPKKYHFKNVNDIEDSKTMGFIAQEVEKLFPEMVSEKYGLKSLAYQDFGILAIKAIQEQQELIIALTERIKLLESKDK